MVQMVGISWNENDIVELDEERKAAMVSNLLVVMRQQGRAADRKQRYHLIKSGKGGTHFGEKYD